MLDKWVGLFAFVLCFSQVFCDLDLLEENDSMAVLKFPQLVLRPVAFGKYLLDVYNPEGMTNFVQDTKAKISNPSCQLESGNLLKPNSNTVTLEFLSKSEVRSSEVDHSLTKAVYRVIVESQGYIRCRAEIFDGGEVTSTRKLYRYSENAFAINVVYNCSKTNCDNVKALVDKLEKSFYKFIDKSILRLKDILVIPVRRSESVEESDAIEIVYRIELTTSPLTEALQLKQGEARGDIFNHKQRDHDLVSFINDAIFKYFTEDDLSHGVCTYVRSTKYCPDVEVERVSWPITKIGVKASTDQLCVDFDGGPLILECLGDFTVGAYWDEVPEIKCQSSTKRMNTLYQISQDLTLNKLTSNDNALKKLEFVLTYQGDDQIELNPLSKVEINSVAEALSSFSSEVINLSDISAIANITNALMQKPSYGDKTSSVIYTNELKSAQESSNSSNRILESLDRILNEAQIDNSTELIITNNFVTLIMEISSETRINRVRGLAAKKSGNSEVKSFNSENIILLTENDRLENILGMDISMAVIVPLELYKNKSQKANRLVINLFLEDSLFGTQRTIGKTNMVLSVTLNGKRYQSLQSPLTILFESEPHSKYFQDNVFSPSPCVFWDFQAEGNNGGWSNYGCELATPPNGTPRAFDVCLCSHLTHFAELLREYPGDIISPQDKIALDIITIVGCSLSLIGLLAIAVTAIVLPDWRKGASKKIQLALCASLAILMASFLVVSFTKGEHLDAESIMESCPCRIGGFLLHYSILSSFCWMIVAAWGQYLRLTKPLVSLNRQPHFILKSSLFAWGVPLIPCIIVLIIDYRTYDPPNCYPTGYFLYFAVLMPVVFAVTVNGTMFFLILFSIYNLCGVGMGLVQLRNNQNKRRIACRKLATVMFLFFLLGMSWIFGIMNLRYLFCITASTQGFSVFIFFVVLDKSTRGKWCNLMDTKESRQMNSYTNSADFIRRWSHQSRTHSRYASTRVSTLSDSR